MKSKEIKTCSTCKRDLPKTHFHKNRSKKDGLQNQCKDCHMVCIKKYQYNKYHTNNLYRYTCNIRQMLYRAFKKQGYTKPVESQVMLGCSFEELQSHLEASFQQQYKIPLDYAKDVLKWECEIDHIIPLSKATCENHIIRLNHYSNLRLLKKDHNRQKGSKLDFEVPLF